MSGPQPAALWRPLTARPAPGSEGPDDLVLRAAVLVVHASAITALVVVDLLDAAVGLLAVLVAVGLSAFARLCLRRPELNALRIGTWAAVSLVTVVVPFLVAVARGLPPSAVLGMFVAGFLAATSADQDGTRRAMLMNLVLGTAVLALAAGLGPLTSHRSGAALGVPVVVGWGAGLVALARASRRHVGASPEAVYQESVRAPSPWRPTAVLVAVTMLVSLAAFGVLSRLPESSSSATGGPSSEFFGQQGGPAPGGDRSVTSYAGGTLDLRARGDLPTDPVMLVEAASPQLWRSALLDQYTGATWAQSTTLGGYPTRGVAGDVGVSTPDDPVPGGASAAARTDRVLWLAPGSFVVPVPGVPSAVSFGPADRAVLYADGTLEVSRGAGTRADDPFGYDVTWLPRPGIDLANSGAAADPDALRAAAPGTGTAPGDPDDGRWLQRSETETPRTIELAQRLAAGLPAGRRTRYDLVRAVEDHLRTTTRYTLDSPVPAEDADAVDDFLFESREGFCEQYASAEVVLLRSLGVPARMAVGFSGGGPVDDPSVGPADGTQRLVRGDDAHAWVEVWFPGVGWVASDPTAGSTLADPPVTSRLAQWLRKHVVLAALLVVVVLGVAVGAWWLLRRRRAEAARTADGGRRLVGGAVDLLAAFDRLEHALAAAGATRAVEETLAELGARLSRGDEEPGATPAPDGVGPVAALAVLERLLYAARPPAPDELRAAAAALDAVAARVLAAASAPAR